METPLSEPVKEAMVKIKKYLEESQPYIFIIGDEVRNLNSGMLTISLRVFNGKVQDVIIHERVRRHKVNYGEEKRGASQAE